MIRRGCGGSLRGRCRRRRHSGCGRSRRRGRRHRWRRLPGLGSSGISFLDIRNCTLSEYRVYGGQDDRLGIGTSQHADSEIGTGTGGERDHQRRPIVGLCTRIAKQSDTRGLGSFHAINHLEPFALQLTFIGNGRRHGSRRHRRRGSGDRRCRRARRRFRRSRDRVGGYLRCCRNRSGRHLTCT